MIPTLTCRNADSIYWLARYIERIENLTRLLDVTHVFTPASQNAQNWQSVLQLHADEAAFCQYYPAITAENVISFYLTDEKNPNSILSCVARAKYNASILRPYISTEMWVQLNTLYNYTQKLKNEPLDILKLPLLFSTIAQRCMVLTGLAETTQYRDQGWQFYNAGKSLERADQITRLLDIKYHLLLPRTEDVGSSLDVAQWFVLLRSASGYHAFRRTQDDMLTPEKVEEFLLLDPLFPRSLLNRVNALHKAIDRLHQQHGLPQFAEVIGLSGALQQQLQKTVIQEIVKSGMHEYLDRVQFDLHRISDTLTQAIFSNRSYL
jgi:uncharacterized alpha-E superfamily protein